MTIYIYIYIYVYICTVILRKEFIKKFGGGGGQKSVWYKKVD